MKCNDSYSTIVIQANSTLKITDTNTNTDVYHYFKYKNNDVWEFVEKPENPESAIAVEAINSNTADDTLIKVAGGVITGNGIANKGTLVVDGVNIVGNNLTNTNGGAIKNMKGEVTINKGMLLGNKALRGGAIVNDAGKLTIGTEGGNNKNILIAYNNAIDTNPEAEAYGGAIYSYNDGTVTDKQAIVTLNSGEIKYNKCERGAGVCGAVVADTLVSKIIIPSNSTIIISNNKASNGGGGIMLRWGATLEMNAGTITDNSAVKWSGGLDIGDKSKATITGGTIANNSSEQKGGGISVRDNGQLIMSGGSVINNTAGVAGGGVHFDEKDKVEHGVTFSGSAVVKDNTSGVDGSKVTDNVYIGATKKITLGTFGNNGSIGVTLGTTDGRGQFIEGTVTNLAQLSNYHSDKGNLMVDLKEQKGMIVDATHAWQYSVNGNQLVAKCKGKAGGCKFDTCGYDKDATAVKLTLSASNANYSGSAVEASYDSTSKTAWEAAGLTAPTIEYYQETNKLSGAPTNAGSYTAKATVGTGAGAATATKDFEITKGEQSGVTVSMSGYTYGGTPSTPSTSGTIKESAAATYYYNTTNSNEGGTAWAGVTGTTLEPGTYYMYATLAATTNYNAFTTPAASFTVNGATFAAGEVTAADYNSAYDGAAHGISVTLSGAAQGATVTYCETENGTYTTTAPTVTDVTTTPKTVYYKVSKTGYNPASGSKTITVTPKEVTLSWTGDSFTYNGQEQAPTATAGGVVTGDTCTVTVSGGKTNVGASYTATATALSNSNYKLPTTNLTHTFAITAKDITVTITPNGGTYGSVTAASAVLNGLVEGDTTTQATLTYTKDTTYNSTTVPTNAGTYTVTATVSNSNYNLTGTTTASFVISPKSLTNTMLTLTPNEYTFGGSKAPSITVKDGETTLALTTDYTVDSTSTTSATDYGEYTIKVNGTGNYTGSAEQKWNINKANMSLTVNGVDTTYDKTAKSISITGAPAGATIQYSTDGNTYSATNPTYTNVGEYTVYYKVTCDNYNDATGSKTVKIAKKAVKVSGITAENKTYDGNTAATLVYTDAAFAGIETGDALTVTATGTFADANVGNSKTVNISNLSLGGTSVGNYKLAESGNQASTTANITAKDITATITPNGGTYGGTITAAAAVFTGVVTGDTVTPVITYTGNDYTGGTVVPTDAGTYTATVTLSGAQAGNYNLTGTATADFTIAKANLKDLKVVVSSNQFDYDGAEKEVAVKVYFVNKGTGEQAEVNSAEYTVVGNKAKDPGTYTITIAAKEGGNLTGSVAVQYSIVKAEDAENKTEETVGIGSASVSTVTTDGAPAAKVEETAAKAFIDAVMDADTKAIVESNGSMEIVLTVDTASDSIQEAITIKDAAKATGVYFMDLKLAMAVTDKFGNTKTTVITDTAASPIQITVTIPAEIAKAPSGYTRSYKVLRYHDGDVKVLDSQKVGDTLVFGGDKFSTYAIAYTDTPIPAPGGNDEYIVCEACGHHNWTAYMGGFKCDNCGHLRGTTGVITPAKRSPKTGDDSNMVLYISVMLLSMMGLVGYMAYSRKRSRK